MRHGYTNDTSRNGGVVTKSYAGPHAETRAAAERQALTALAGLLPVPAVVDTARVGSLTMAFIPGRHGQDLVDAGHSGEVLQACGQVLRQLHSIEPRVVFGQADGSVIVHGDFGPNNVLFSPEPMGVVAVLDWEFCHVGEPLEDLAWCEWIVRAHHPDSVSSLASLFDGYGWTPPWPERRAAMLRQCAFLTQFCREWDPLGAGVAMWADRTARTSAWHE